MKFRSDISGYPVTARVRLPGYCTRTATRLPHAYGYPVTARVRLPGYCTRTATRLPHAYGYPVTACGSGSGCSSCQSSGFHLADLRSLAHLQAGFHLADLRSLAHLSRLTRSKPLAGYVGEAFPEWDKPFCSPVSLRSLPPSTPATRQHLETVFRGRPCGAGGAARQAACPRRSAPPTDFLVVDSLDKCAYSPLLSGIGRGILRVTH